MAHRRQGNQVEQVLKIRRGLSPSPPDQRKEAAHPTRIPARRRGSPRTGLPTALLTGSKRSPVALGLLYCECFVMVDPQRANTESRLRNTDRIVVLGTTCAGRPRSPRQMVRAMEMPLIELDYYRFRPNWVEAPDDEFRESVKEALRDDRWVADGNYGLARDIIPIRSDYVAICMTSVPIRHSGEGRNPESPISKNTAASHRIGIIWPRATMVMWLDHPSGRRRGTTFAHGSPLRSDGRPMAVWDSRPFRCAVGAKFRFVLRVLVRRADKAYRQ